MGAREVIGVDNKNENTNWTEKVHAITSRDIVDCAITSRYIVGRAVRTLHIRRQMQATTRWCAHRLRGIMGKQGNQSAAPERRSLPCARNTNTLWVARVERGSRENLSTTRFETTSLLCPKKNKPKTLSD